MSASDDVRKRAMALRQSVRHNAKHRGIGFELTTQEAIEILNASEGRCALSGIRLDDNWDGTSRCRPFAPSFDRIDSNKPYTKANVRVVCVAVNYALSDWGEDVFKLVALGVCEKNGWAAKPARLARPRGVVARPHANGVRYEVNLRWDGRRWFLGTFRSAGEAGQHYERTKAALRVGKSISQFLPSSSQQMQRQPNPSDTDPP